MNKCTNCNYTAKNDEKTCPICGSEMVSQAPVSNAKRITGMVLSAVGLHNAAFSVLSFFMVSAGSGVFLPSFISLPCSIVGLILSIQCIKAGDDSQFSRLGRLFGILGISAEIVNTVLTTIALVALILFYIAYLAFIFLIAGLDAAATAGAYYY